MISNFYELETTVRGGPRRRLVAAAANDEHTVEAVLTAARAGAVDYLLTGDSRQIAPLFAQLDEPFDPSRVVEATDDAMAARAAVALVRAGRGDFLMKGMLPTAALLREVVSHEEGLRGAEGSVMSHAALLEWGGRFLLVTDGGMLPHPDLAQKAAILKNGLALLRALGEGRPRAAVLCAAETVSDRMPETLDAAALSQRAAAGEFGDCLVGGPLSLDLAISPESCALKGYSGPVAGDAQLLLCPDIASGNLMSKAMMLCGGAVMAGCVLGARAPVVVCSRAASAEEKYFSILLAAALC